MRVYEYVGRDVERHRDPLVHRLRRRRLDAGRGCAGGRHHAAQPLPALGSRQD